jgi:hypothetical protein
MMNDFAPKWLLGKSSAESVKGGIGIAIFLIKEGNEL